VVKLIGGGKWELVGGLDGRLGLLLAIMGQKAARMEPNFRKAGCRNKEDGWRQSVVDSQWSVVSRACHPSSSAGKVFPRIPKGFGTGEANYMHSIVYCFTDRV
jgi:hypothetical protein